MSNKQAGPKPLFAFRTVGSGEAAEPGMRDGTRQRRMAAQLQRKLDQHRMSNRPFMICRMDPAESLGDASLLDAFAAEVRFLATLEDAQHPRAFVTDRLQGDTSAVADQYIRSPRAPATPVWVD